VGEACRVIHDIIVGIKHGKGLITLLTDEADQSEVPKTIARIRAADKIQRKAATMPSQRRNGVACFTMGNDIAPADMDKKMAAEEKPANASKAKTFAPTMAKCVNQKADLNVMARTSAYKSKGPEKLSMEFYFSPPDPMMWKQIINVHTETHVCPYQVLTTEEPSIPAQVYKPDKIVIKNGQRDVLSYVKNKGNS
jgi:hypothetical protein